MSKAIEDLMHEHEAILSATNILERIADNLDKGLPANQDDVQNFINFLKEFADGCHHGKEENILFPALIGAGMPDRGGPIGTMMNEHDLGRQLIHQMESAVGPSMDPPRLAQAAHDYIALLREHIRKENMILFPMAERALSDAQKEGIYERFEEHEEKVIGHGRHEQLHAVLADLEQKYPAG